MRKRSAIWLVLSALALPMAAANPAGVAEDDRQQILARLADAVPPARLHGATVFLGGDLAAVRMPAETDDRVIYVLERPAGSAAPWRTMARITAAGEEHFGDAVLFSPNAILVASPDAAGAGLGPGSTYVFQRHVGGTDHWGLVAKLAPEAFPPAGAITVLQLSEHGPTQAPVAPSPTAVAAPPADAVSAPGPPSASAPPAAAAVAISPPAVASPPAAVAADEGPDEPVAATEEASRREDEPASELRYIAVANMRERPRALALAASLRDRGYASEVHRNDRDFFVVTLARLPVAEARKKRAEAVAAGDVPRDAYLIVGTGFREKISP